MYVIGQGHEHLGPGTSMVQRINWTTGDEAEMRAGFGRGLAGYGGVDEFRPDCLQMSRSCSEKGLGCACSGKCGRGCGLGIFDNGFDPSSFGPLEWAAVAGAGYMLVSTFFTTKRAVGAARAYPAQRRKRKAKEAKQAERDTYLTSRRRN